LETSSIVLPELLPPEGVLPTGSVDAGDVPLGDMPFPGPDDGPIDHGHEDVPPDRAEGAVGPFGNPVDDPGPTNQRRSGQTRVQTQHFIESQQQRDEGLVAYVATRETIDPMLYQEDHQLQQFKTDPIAFALKASSDPDTMYYHKAMKEKDVPQFWTAMTKEVDAHTSGKSTNGRLGST
jgi:hypothetical protein